MINKLAKEIHKNAKNKGFYKDKKNIGEMLCLIHSEVSEALEADRKMKYCELDNENWNIDDTLRNDLIKFDDIQFISTFKMAVKGTFEDELADIMIRVMDLAEYKGIDLEAHIKAKMRYNLLEHKY